MGLDISSPNKSVTLEAGSGGGIFDLAEALGVAAPELRKIGERFWSNPTVSSVSQVQSLLDEVERLRSAHEASVRQRLVREKDIRTKDAAARERILGPLLLREPLLATLLQLEDVCRDAVREGALLTFCSD